MGYERSPIAHGLATNRTGLIGVIDSGSNIVGQILLRTGVEQAARSLGFAVRTVMLDESDYDKGLRADALRSLQKDRVEGLIVMGNTTLHLQAAQLAASEVPVVLVTGTPIPEPNVATITIDQRGGTLKLLAHLRDRGRTKIGHISGPRRWVDADVRRNTWQEDVGASASLVIEGDWGPRSGYDAGKRLLDLGVDAIFAANDYMALGALRACREVELPVPDMISIAGFDDVLGAEYYEPTLTTVRQPMENLGTRAVEMLVNRIEGGDIIREILPTELIIREST